jgi:hypothetical protein
LPQRVPLLREPGDAVFVSDVGLADLGSALGSPEALEAMQAS